MRKVFFFIALIFTVFVVYNIDIIQHRRSHKRIYVVQRENHTGWHKTYKVNEPKINLRHAQSIVRVDIDGEF